METPYFKFKPDVLKINYLKFEELCNKYLKNYVIAYSVKTNGSSGVIDLLKNLGSNFEVASINEIKKVPGRSRVFNGCSKNEEELRYAIENKFLINVDSKSEIDKISRIVEGMEFSIGLRVSGNKGKFGFEPEKLEEIIDYCNSKNLKVICLQFHLGTQQNLRDFEENIRDAEIIIEKIKDKINLKYIDIGGGFPDNSKLKNLGANLEDYFKSIEKYLRKFETSIILEPGRNLVADAFELITRVNIIKEKFGKKYAILDVGINALSKITLAYYRFEKLENTKEDISNANPDDMGNSHTNVGGSNHNEEGNDVTINEVSRGIIRNDSNANSVGDTKKNKKKEEYILAGPLLFNNDLLGRYFGNLEEGDLIKIENVGAYCYNLAWEISYSKPKVLIE